MITTKNNQILREKSEEIDPRKIKGAKIQAIIKKMKEELSQSKEGVAIAAPQIGVNLRIFVIDKILINPELAISEADEKKEMPARGAALAGGKKEFAVFINPRVAKKSSKKMLLNEGCLSVPGVFKNIKRAEKLTIEAYDENGKQFKKSATKTFSQAIQHEIDHLDGILFTDRSI